MTTTMTMTMTMTANQKAFLDMLAYAEGTSTSPATKNNGYDVIVTGKDRKPEIFTNYSEHPFAFGRPAKAINDKGLFSSASGRYQFLVRDWKHYRDLLNLKDFSPENQDRWALQLIREAKALPFIDAGAFAAAVKKCRHLWASLPGAGYRQPERNLADLKRVYEKAGGTVSSYNIDKETGKGV